MHSLKLIIVWNVALTILLLASLAANAAWVQAASDPPVRVHTANADDAGAGGSSSTTVHDITSAISPTVLVSVSTNLSTLHTHTCLVMGSASANAVVNNGVSNGGGMAVGLSKDDPTSIPLNTARFAEFAAGSFPATAEVSTTHAFLNISGTHIFYFSAQKERLGSPSTKVVGAAITVVCIKKSF